MKPLHHATQRIARQVAGKEYAALAQVLEYWADIVGPKYASQCAPIKISLMPSGPNKKVGTLTLRAPRGLIPELSYAQVHILSRLNGFMGHLGIDKLHFEASTQTSNMKKQPQHTDKNNEIEPPAEHMRALEKISDTELRESLYKLALAIARNKA